MDLHFTQDALKAVLKAGCKSEVLTNAEERWGSLTVESKFMNPSDFEIIKKVVLGNEELKADIENRRLVRKLKTLEVVGKKGTKLKVPKLEILPDLIRDLVAETKNKWVFVPDKSFGVMLPYFVFKSEFHPPNRRAETPANVTLNLVALVRGGAGNRDESHDSITVRFEKMDLVGTVEETLRAADVFLETPELIAEYEADLKFYHAESGKTGEQYLGRGIAVGTERSWRTGSVSLESDGVATKLIMDDLLDLGSASDMTATTFWNKEHVDDDEEDEIKDSFKIPTHPIVKMFSLHKHEYLLVHISSLEVYQYDTKAAEKLVLPDDHKELINALTGSAIKKIDDIVKGKASGIIVISSGDPGTGKTLTAEIYSETIKRPLYTVQCSQLGTDEEELEKKLNQVMERATRWKAILLIDEADVYIHERGDDIQQNAIVGVFLRLLEYYSGILFLTTNRATVIDDAIMSRATAHVRYLIPTEDDKRKRLWEVLSKQYEVKLDIAQAMKIFPAVSGRTIRQLIRLSKIMADTGKQEVTIGLLKWAAKFHDFSENEKANLEK